MEGTWGRVNFLTKFLGGACSEICAPKNAFETQIWQCAEICSVT